MSLDEQSFAPVVIRILADTDGHARWKGVVMNTDTGHKAIELLITINEDSEVIAVATRPPGGQGMWSPPIDLRRQGWWM